MRQRANERERSVGGFSQQVYSANVRGNICFRDSNKTIGLFSSVTNPTERYRQPCSKIRVARSTVFRIERAPVSRDRDHRPRREGDSSGLREKPAERFLSGDWNEHVENVENVEREENRRKRLPLELSSDRIRFIIQQRGTRAEGQRPACISSI